MALSVFKQSCEALGPLCRPSLELPPIECPSKIGYNERSYLNCHGFLRGAYRWQRTYHVHTVASETLPTRTSPQDVNGVAVSFLRRSTLRTSLSRIQNRLSLPKPSKHVGGTRTSR